MTEHSSSTAPYPASSPTDSAPLKGKAAEAGEAAKQAGADVAQTSDQAKSTAADVMEPLQK